MFYRYHFFSANVPAYYVYLCHVVNENRNFYTKRHILLPNPLNRLTILNNSNVRQILKKNPLIENVTEHTTNL